jgi:putative oxidoreductase
MMIETSRPSQPSLRELFAAATDRLGRFPLTLVQLMARVAVAAVFWNSGQTKIASWDITVALFAEEYRVPLLPPEIAAYLATTAELTCPVLLLFGFGGRFGAAALLGMTLVIQTFVYPENWVEHLTWATMLLFLLTRGSGAISLDRLIGPWLLGGR